MKVTMHFVGYHYQPSAMTMQMNHQIPLALETRIMKVEQPNDYYFKLFKYSSIRELKMEQLQEHETKTNGIGIIPWLLQRH